MLATIRSINAVQHGDLSAVTEAAVDHASRQNFLKSIPLSLATNAVPLALLTLCMAQLGNWSLMACFLALNTVTIYSMYLVTRHIQGEKRALRNRLLWNVYEFLAFFSGLFWAACMLPVVNTLGHDIAAMFVCVVIIVSVAVTSMVIATQWRAFVSFLAGVMLGLVPQTIFYLDAIGTIPLLATLGLAPALAVLAHAVHKQDRQMIRTRLEKERLAAELADALAAAEYLANRDSLTGLYNRRAFEAVADQISQDGAVHPLSLILVDLDHFKSINDRYGHAAGDAVLKRTAELICRYIGQDDLMGRGDGASARWGGEEFILLLRRCPAQDAAQIAATLRAELPLMRSPAWPNELIVTGSFGVATWHAEMPLHLAISNADQAMYQAKQAGRNQVRVHDTRDYHPPTVSREAVAFLQRKQRARPVPPRV